MRRWSHIIYIYILTFNRERENSKLLQIIINYGCTVSVIGSHSMNKKKKLINKKYINTES